MTNDLRQKVQWLVEEFNRASDNYYSGHAESITDFEQDAKFNELKRLEQESGLVLPDSPITNVSDGTITGQKEAHEFPVLLLTKTKEPEELVRWAEKLPIQLSWKLDGLTLVVTYDSGKLTRVVTHGNRRMSTSITHLAPTIQGIPVTIKSDGHLVIRGKAVISYANFEVFNMKANETYANPHNLASGSLTLKDVGGAKQRKIQWIPLTLVFTDEAINSWGEHLGWFREVGFDVVKHERISDPFIHNVNQAIEQQTNLMTHSQCPFPVDDLVITFDDTAFAATGSITGHHTTHAGLALKWRDETATTELEYIE